MTVLHYGSEVRIRIDDATTRQLMEAVGAHASRGGWVTVTDVTGREWSYVVSGGIPIWITESE